MKILVVYATAGAGHKKAAEALHQGLLEVGFQDAVYLDVLDYTNRFYKNLYSRLYAFLITRVPGLWGFSFWIVDIPLLQPLIRFLRRLHNTVHAGRFHRYLIQQQFDVIFSTHFFPNEVAGYLKITGRISSRIICAVTDFDVHRIWLTPGVDVYTVASDWTRKKIVSLGIDASRVVVSGIPVLAKFTEVKDPAALKQKLSLDASAFTLLLATGSFGIGPIEAIIEQMQGFQVLVVCGHNRGLYERLLRGGKSLVKIYGLVDNMDELMAVADVMITKPGGLSISEALVSALPLIFFNAIPGQESHNVAVLKEHDIGYEPCRIEDMRVILTTLRDSPEAYQTARQKTRVLARPQAVKEIIDLIR